MSLICGPGITAGPRTLDLVFNSEKQRSIWYDGVTAMTVLERVALDDSDRKALRWAFLREVHCPRPAYYMQHSINKERKLLRRWSENDIRQASRLKSFDSCEEKYLVHTWDSSLRSRIYYWQFQRLLHSLNLRRTTLQQKEAFHRVATEQNSVKTNRDAWTINYEGFVKAVDLLKIHPITILIWTILSYVHHFSDTIHQGKEADVFGTCMRQVERMMEQDNLLDTHIESSSFDEFFYYVQRQSPEDSLQAKSLIVSQHMPLEHSLSPTTKAHHRYREHHAETVSLPGFASFLFSCANSTFSYSLCRFSESDMMHPLRDYYISSSHNTYLEGDQLAGKSSANAYINALQHGCRSVELDCWDGPKGEPLVYHGRTLTTHIWFENVVSALATYAFTNSDLPLILSLEMHCSVEQQDRISEILQENFGRRLGPVFREGMDYEETRQILSPHHLRRRVLVKGKARQTQHFDEAMVAKALTKPSGSRSVNSRNLIPPEGCDQSCKICESYSESLSGIITLKALKFNLMIDISENLRSPFSDWHMCSVKEPTLQKYVYKQESKVQWLTQRHLVRVYPGPLRVDSSNFNPTPYWANGVQMVALNFQTRSYAKRLNQALFRLNGKSGYVFKPQGLRHASNEPYIPVQSKLSCEEEHVSTAKFISILLADFNSRANRRASMNTVSVSSIFHQYGTSSHRIRIVVLAGNNLPLVEENANNGREVDQLECNGYFRETGASDNCLSPFVKCSAFEDSEAPCIAHSSVLPRTSANPSWIELPMPSKRYDMSSTKANINSFCYTFKYPDRGFIHLAVYHSLSVNASKSSLETTGPVKARGSDAPRSLRNLLKNEKNILELGYCCIPLRGMVPGIRCCPLRDPDTGKKIPFSSLLCYVHCPAPEA